MPRFEPIMSRIRSKGRTVYRGGIGQTFELLTEPGNAEPLETEILEMNKHQTVHHDLFLLIHRIFSCATVPFRGSR
jgi:hypothetical protein